MQQFFLIMQIIGQLLPIITQTVKAVEDVLPQSGQGQAKLDMVRVALQAAFSQVQNAEVTFDQIWPPVSAMIQVMVAAFNVNGTFAKK